MLCSLIWHRTEICGADRCGRFQEIAVTTSTIIIVDEGIEPLKATAVARFCEDQINCIQGRTKNFYQEAFCAFILKGFQKIVGYVGIFVRTRGSDELGLFFQFLSRSGPKIREIAFDATIKALFSLSYV